MCRCRHCGEIRSPFGQQDIRPVWFPDWRGRTAAVIGSGPSLVAEDVAALKGRGAVLAVNRAHELAPWADALYACDSKFWEHHHSAREFTGLKVTQDALAAERFGIHRVVLATNNVEDIPGFIGSGGNSGFQAINLAMQFGAKRIILLGFDMSLAHGGHWHGDHPLPLHNPNPNTIRDWLHAFEVAAPQYRERGVEIINCSRRTALTCFPRMDLECI